MPGEPIAILFVAPSEATTATLALDLVRGRPDVCAIRLAPHEVANRTQPVDLVVTVGERARAAWDEVQSLGPPGGTLHLHWADPEAPEAAIVRQVQQLTERMLPGLKARRQRLRGPVAVVPADVEPPVPEAFHGIVGTSAVMMAVFERVRKFARSNYPVLLGGETGTGKELVARAVHLESARRDRPFIALNCGTLSLQLADSDLFGHVKGAFTGAHSNRRGIFERAQHGTVFLDEIGELPLEQQVKLLRVMQEHCFEPVGSSRTVRVDVRVVCATHRDLEAGVRQGWFRADLYYRLNVLALVVPPLRERREDVPLLLRHALDEVSRATGRTFQPLDVDILSRLSAYDWPGNVRELGNLVNRAAILSSGKALNMHLLDPRPVGATAAPMPSAPGPTPRRQPAVPKTRLDNASVDEALRRANGNRSQAAVLLGVSRSTLYRHLDDPGRVREPG